MGKVSCFAQTRCAIIISVLRCVGHAMCTLCVCVFYFSSRIFPILLPNRSRTTIKHKAWSMHRQSTVDSQLVSANHNDSKIEMSFVICFIFISFLFFVFLCFRCRMFAWLSGRFREKSLVKNRSNFEAFCVEKRATKKNRPIPHFLFLIINRRYTAHLFLISNWMWPNWVRMKKMKKTKKKQKTEAVWIWWDCFSYGYATDGQTNFVYVYVCVYLCIDSISA